MEINIQHPNEILAHLPTILAYPEGRKVWLFSGKIGAGKTTLIQRICSHFNVEDEVTSPSYSLVNEYHGNEIIYHIDLYRLKSIEEALDIGIEEYLFSHHYCFIEWPSLIEPLITEMPVLKIQIENKANSGRKILFLKE